MAIYLRFFFCDFRWAVRASLSEGDRAHDRGRPPHEPEVQVLEVRDVRAGGSGADVQWPPFGNRLQNQNLTGGRPAVCAPGFVSDMPIVGDAGVRNDVRGARAGGPSVEERRLYRRHIQGSEDRGRRSGSSGLEEGEVRDSPPPQQRQSRPQVLIYVVFFLSITVLLI